jgi:hypothetical protein
MKVHPVFHVSQLEGYKEPTLVIRQLHKPPDPVVDEDGIDEGHEVSQIVASRWSKAGILEYKVLWVGYTSDQATWVDAEDFFHDDALVVDFHSTHPRAVCSENRREIVKSKMREYIQA